MQYISSPQAVEDIDLIWLRIARENLKAADRVAEEFYKVFELLSIFPFSGSVKPEFTNKPYRWFPVKGYWVAYTPSSPIKVARVINSYRDIPSQI